DTFQWTQCEMRQSGSEYERKQDCGAGEKQSMLQLWSEFVFQEHSGNAHANTPEGSAVQLQRHTHVIDRRRVVHESQLLTETGIFHPLECRPVGNPLTDEIGIGVKNRVALGVDNGSVVDHGPTADHGFKKVVEVAVGSE